MIRWSFWVDEWEHPFNTSNRISPASIPLAAAVIPSLVAMDEGLANPPKIDIERPKPTKWDWSKFRMPFFEHGFTRERTSQPGPFDYYLSNRGPAIPGGEYGVTDDEALAVAWANTGKAAMQGALIASLDGPIPVMDIFGFAWASYKTVEAWEEYREVTS